MLNSVGAVAIGRNEGERLRRCLESMAGQVATLVYVDSGSTDGSLETARDLGCEVVELDTSIPFTAARARNAGFARLKEVDGAVRFLQFVDGDCQVVDGWLATAVAALESDELVAAVCGRRREIHPRASIYNLLCDMEWDTPIGEADACGGDAMMRVRAFEEAAGFNASLIAGEEPELCVRFRQHGFRILRLDAEMTRHDAAMTRFRQWWKRSVRAGHAFAEGAWMHGRSPQQHWVRESRSVWFWGLIVPFLAIAGAWPTRGLSCVLLAGYPVLAYRVCRWCRSVGNTPSDARLYALFCVLGKCPQLLGQVKFLTSRLFSRQATLIEYK